MVGRAAGNTGRVVEAPERVRGGGTERPSPGFAPGGEDLEAERRACALNVGGRSETVGEHRGTGRRPPRGEGKGPEQNWGPSPGGPGRGGWVARLRRQHSGDWRPAGRPLAHIGLGQPEPVGARRLSCQAGKWGWPAPSR